MGHYLDNVVNWLIQFMQSLIYEKRLRKSVQQQAPFYSRIRSWKGFNLIEEKFLLP